MITYYAQKSLSKEIQFHEDLITRTLKTHGKDSRLYKWRSATLARLKRKVKAPIMSAEDFRG